MLLHTRTRVCICMTSAAGYYIWRENGLANGRCLGFDVNKSPAINTYAPFAYDAAMAMMRGLHAFIEGGGNPDKLTAKTLFNEMTKVSFDGASNLNPFVDVNRCRCQATGRRLPFFV